MARARPFTLLKPSLLLVLGFMHGSACLPVVTPDAVAQNLPQSIDWNPVSKDIDVSRFTVSVGALFTSSLVVVRSPLTQHHLRVIRASEFGWRRANVKSLCKAAGATVCINASFFDEQGRALGLLINRGIIHQKMHKGGSVLTGVLLATSKQIRITARDTFTTEQAIEAVQSGPRLVADGQPVRGLHDASLSSNLSGACIDKDGNAVLYRVTSGMFGCTIRQLQKILLSPLISCVDAINFDGGGSSQMYISEPIPQTDPSGAEIYLAGADEVPVAVGLFAAR